MTEPQTDGKLRGACECQTQPNPLFILDQDGTPIPCPDVDRWDVWMSSETNTCVALSRINGVIILTRFIGFRHPAPPQSGLEAIFFETRILRGFFGSDSIATQTIRGAKLAHLRAVEVVTQFRFIPVLIQDALRLLNEATSYIRLNVARALRALLS